MQYGFVIDQETCIGCHACTVACKAENDVPVGGFRTNVKYVEIGKFPRVKRSFLVQRCNHCTDAPCVAICPVNALTKRKDGIVDIDRDACIGCRACMQACPYDALYLNEDLGAVEKCHFCAHRIEKNLQPACVTVCPVGAIIPGDFDDPDSKVSLLKRARDLKVRRPEQGTGPNVFYVGAENVALNPGEAERPRHYIWSQRRPTKPEPWPNAAAPPQTDASEVMNAEHKIEWGWPVALYLLTKGIAAGASLVAPILAQFGESSFPSWWLPESIALVFSLITVFLLVEDLAKPVHFYKLFTRPNWNSWLVKGGIVLTAFMGLSAVILALGFLDPYSPIIQPLRWANAALGLGVAGYTAFLFGQCKGRDLWESPLLLPNLLFQAALCGGITFLVVNADFVVRAFAGLGLVGFLAFALAESFGHHPTANARQAAGFLRTVRAFGLPAFASGLVLSLIGGALALFGLPFAAAPVLAGLFLYEYAFVRAGQLPPLS